MNIHPNDVAFYYGFLHQCPFLQRTLPEMYKWEVLLKVCIGIINSGRDAVAQEYYV